MRKHVLCSLLAIGLTACWHQVVSTGAPPGPTVIDKPFVATYVFGLVPAGEIDVRSQCPAGTAKVETEMSVVNWLATVVTIGIYSPRHVTITCAAGPVSTSTAQLWAKPGADATSRKVLLNQAVQLSAERHESVIIHF